MRIWKEWFYSCTDVFDESYKFFFKYCLTCQSSELSDWLPGNVCLEATKSKQTILQLTVQFLRYWCSWVFYMFALFLYPPTLWAVATSQTRKSWIIKWLNEDVSSKEQAKAWAQMVWFRELCSHCTQQFTYRQKKQKKKKKKNNKGNKKQLRLQVIFVSVILYLV